MKKRKYWLLLSRDNMREPWAMEFGAYVRSDVAAERDYYRQQYAASNLKIISSGDTQAEIDAAINEINEQGK